MSNKYVFILAGGRGERFWPKSRLDLPKHLLAIAGNSPMICQTIKRVKGIVPINNIFVITNIKHKLNIQKYCPDLGPDQIIAESIGRDTAAAVAVALAIIKHKNPNGVFAILPADHKIHNEKKFKISLQAAFLTAKKTSFLVSIGIQPTIPATGYGYIKRGKIVFKINGNSIFKVEKFVEKPNALKAKTYLSSKNYYWNTGIFIWTVKAIETAFKKYAPEYFKMINILLQGLALNKSIESLIRKEYLKVDKSSIDYTLMEKAKEIIMIESIFDWDDVGDWLSIERHYPKDKQSNVIRGEAIIAEGSKNIIFNDNESDHLITMIGISNVIVVRTKDATLICSKKHSQEIKNIVQKIGTIKKYSHLL